MMEWKPKDRAKIKKLCHSLKRTIRVFSKSKLFQKQPRLFSVYGEIIVIYNLLKRGHRITRGKKVKGGNPKIDFELVDSRKKIEVKTSSLKNGAFSRHYSSSQRGKFDYLVLVGFDEFDKDHFYIFTKDETKHFYKTTSMYKPVYAVDVYKNGLPPRKKLSKSMIKINKNIKNYENRWDKIK